MAEPFTASLKSSLLGGAGAILLKPLLTWIEKGVEPGIVKKMKQDGSALKGTPTDADKALFVRHAVRHFAHSNPLTKPFSDPLRDYLTPHVQAAALAAGFSDTATGVHAVGAALVEFLSTLLTGL